ncbi:MAG: antibiotic biosynthesis monooxygenase [Pseudomonadota bacterium]
MDEFDVVTLIVRHRVKPGQEAAYEQWLRRTTRIASNYPGHLGVNIMRDRGQFVCVLRFVGTRELQHWLDSSERRHLIEEVAPLLAEGDQFEVEASREFWFTPSPLAAPPRWKQACITFLVILPLSLLVPLLWQPLFARLPWLGGYLIGNLLITLSIVLSVVYLFMPRVTALFATWLTPSTRAGATHEP